MHTTADITDLLRRWQWEIVEHPPYSPDMSPCNYDLFAKMETPLRGIWYNTRDEIIRGIGLPNIWHQVTNNRGDYIEGGGEGSLGFPDL